jgi:hypothetical protein
MAEMPSCCSKASNTSSKPLAVSSLPLRQKIQPLPPSGSGSPQYIATSVSFTAGPGRPCFESSGGKFWSSKWHTDDVK